MLKAGQRFSVTSEMVAIEPLEKRMCAVVFPVGEMVCLVKYPSDSDDRMADVLWGKKADCGVWPRSATSDKPDQSDVSGKRGRHELTRGRKARMAQVFLIGLEPAIAAQMSLALHIERHWVTQHAETIGRRDLTEADVVFAGGPASRYMPLLRRVRKERPTLPFIVVTRAADTTEWLDALQAGATDYCSWPIETRQINWLMETALRNMGAGRHGLIQSRKAGCGSSSDERGNSLRDCVLVAAPASRGFIGASPASTGKPWRFDCFMTPPGVFEHSIDNPDFRAKGTRNGNGKGVKGWGLGGESRMRLQMHATDPDLPEQRLGTAQSKGCIRIPATKISRRQPADGVPAGDC